MQELTHRVTGGAQRTTQSRRLIARCGARWRGRRGAAGGSTRSGRRHVPIWRVAVASKSPVDVNGGALPRGGRTRVAPLAGKTRALQETNTNSPWHDKGDDFRKALKEFQAKVTKWVLVVAARIKLYYLKARAFARASLSSS